MMTRIAMALMLLAGPARAALTQADLAGVAADPAPGARLDLGLARPTVLIFADFNCAQLCDAVVAQTGAELAATGLTPGTDYALAVVGIDPRDDPGLGRAMIAAQVPAAVQPGARLFTPDATRLAAMTTALGYSFRRDPDSDSFAHPAVRYVLTADGRVARVLPAFAATGPELAAALADARAGRTGVALTGPLALFCYGFNPATGRYGLAIDRILTAGCLLTALALAATIGLLVRRERRRAV